MIVLVLGTGRSGTSTVARLLHKKLGVHMGGPWVKWEGRSNPGGYYEDESFGRIISRAQFSINLEVFQRDLLALIHERTMQHDNWGIKANTLCYCLPFVLDLLLEKPKIIWCRRSLPAVLISWVRHFRMSFCHAMKEITIRQAALEAYAARYDMREIWFDQRKTDDEVLGEMREALA